MAENYYIIHNPLTFNLMGLRGQCKSPLELLSYLTNLNSSDLDKSNFTNYLKFDLSKQRKGMIETFAMESYAQHYIANQIAYIKPNLQVILSDEKRRPLDKIISEKGKPEAVFMTSMSSNFPTAAATTIALNHSKIPVVLGGIHVSTSPNDIDTYIRNYTPHPDLISQVRGAGDNKTLIGVITDIQEQTLKSEYLGYETIENGIWGAKNIQYMKPLNMNSLKRIPLIGNTLVNKFRVNTITPYLGCPYSCNFCSISTLPQKQRKFQSRNADDFVDELKSFQEKGVDYSNRIFFFLPDNLLLGGKKLEKILDQIIDSNLKINYAAQISIEVANNESLMNKLRLSGAMHFFIGMESLDLRNLESIGKNAVNDIKKKGLTVREYYTQQIKKIQDKGISVHGAFIAGLPYDKFNNLDNHTGIELADFCIENKIGLQLCSLTDLPGSKNFNESQSNGTYIYGKQGTMDYLLSLCISDLSEINKIPPDSLHNSPLIVAHMAYTGIKKACSTENAIKNGMFMAKKSWDYPTKNGHISHKERAYDSISSFASQLIVSQYLDHGNRLAYSTKNNEGSFERLYNSEKDPKIKKMFKKPLKEFFYQE